MRLWLQSIDWKLFLFLLLFLNVKMVVKVIALLLIYMLRPDFRFGFSFKRKARLPFFYVLIIGIAILNWICIDNFSDTNYTMTTLTGIGFWLLCILAIHQVKLAVDTSNAQLVHNTLLLFFISNAVFSFITLGAIIGEIGAINPYLYQGDHQKYFIGTGDAIKGISFDTSATNAIINAFGVVYSLKRSKFFLTLICMSTILLTASNLTNLLLLTAIFFLFIFQSTRNQKSIIVVCSLMLLVFLVKISPQNGSYAFDYSKKLFNKETTTPVMSSGKTSLLKKPDSLLNTDEKKQKIAILYLDSFYKVWWINRKREPAEEKLPIVPALAKPSIPKADIHSESYQKNNDTTLLQKNLLAFAENKITSFDTGIQNFQKRGESGKFIAFKQTIDFFKQHPSKIFIGAGIGNFSSKLALRVTGLGIGGGYPEKLIYINNDFKNNHLKLHLYYFSKHAGLHSLTNTPNSVYDQLLAEYGLIGMLSFIVFYLGFFIKYLRRLTYGVPLLIVFIGVCWADYWFEQLSIIVLFELMIFLNIKETKEISGT